MREYYDLLLSVLLFAACSLSGCNKGTGFPSFLITDAEKTYHISLDRVDSGNYSIFSSIGDDKYICEWKLHTGVFRFECADIDGNGVNDIVVGVVKQTRFDSVSRKRIFIFKLLDGYIRPLWLGSRVSQPLVDFAIITEGNVSRIRTIEKERNGNYLVAEYKWSGFGLAFVKYIKRFTTLTTAQHKLEK